MRVQGLAVQGLAARAIKKTILSGLAPGERRSSVFASQIQCMTTNSTFVSPREHHSLAALSVKAIATRHFPGQRGGEKWPFMAAGALSFSFAASSFSTAVAKERPPAEFIPKEIVLYQYEACPFCNKVKAYLDYHDLAYKVVEVNPISKKEIKWSDYKKVPILMVDGEQLNDSSAIIAALDKRIYPTKEGLPQTIDAEEEKKWCRWVDEHLVHVLSPNIYRNPTEALESFDYITKHGNFTTLERLTGKYVGATAMYFVSKKLKKKHNITDERASLYEAADTWVKALDNRTFMGGSKPNLADLAVFGVLRPIRHLQSGRDMIENTNIGPWYSRMEVAVGASSGIKE